MKVTFYTDPEGSIFAYFPNEICDSQNNRQSYAHIGQHSACSPEYVKECKPAKHKDYKDLLSELENIGYSNLQITNPKEKIYSPLNMCKKAYREARTQKGRQAAMNRAMLNLPRLEQVKFLNWQIKYMKGE